MCGMTLSLKLLILCGVILLSCWQIPWSYSSFFLPSESHALDVSANGACMWHLEQWGGWATLCSWRCVLLLCLQSLLQLHYFRIILFDASREQEMKRKHTYLSCDPPSFVHWAVRVLWKLWWPVIKLLKICKEGNVVFSEWAWSL